jgi:protein SCO1/2
VHLKSEILGDRLVVMDFLYTSCTTVCPVVSAVLAQVQEQLGPRLAKEVALVSVSVDPQRDTPARLKAYAARHGARSGWSWLTGTPANIAEVLKSAGTYTPNFEDHPAVILVGDPRSGQWTRHYGFADPKDLVARLEALALARKGGAATTRKE